MPQSIANVLVHLIFSTANREPFLREAGLRKEMHRYLSGVIVRLGGRPVEVGGVADHVHILCVLPKSISTSDLVRDLKRASSLWVKEREPEMKGFAWQKGYGVFSVGQNEAEVVRKYIVGQEEHHRERTFQEEYRGFLKKYGVVFDERYLWE